MKFYIPTWFNIKAEESVFKGSIHFFNLIRRCQKVDHETRNVVQPVIKHNSFFAHSECILLSMLTDASETMRKLAFARIRKARSSTTTLNKREYQLPEVNFEARNYMEMISWKSIYAQDEDGNETGVFRTEYTDTPLLSGYSLQEIECMAQKGRVPCDLYNLPCHNQKVDRAFNCW